MELLAQFCLKATRSYKRASRGHDVPGRYLAANGTPYKVLLVNCCIEVLALESLLRFRSA